MVSASMTTESRPPFPSAELVISSRKLSSLTFEMLVDVVERGERISPLHQSDAFAVASVG